MKNLLWRIAVLVTGLFLWSVQVTAEVAPLAEDGQATAKEGPSLSLSISSSRDVKVSTAAAETAETYEGMPAGFTDDGNPFLGSPDAPVVLEEWSDYLCPFCGRHFQQTLPELKNNYIRSGRMQLVFRDLPFASLHPTAARGHVAARCVARQGKAAHYWAMHHELFSRQGEWSRLPDPAAFLSEAARKAGADMTAYGTCVHSDEIAGEVEASITEGQSHGFNGTPSFRFIDAKSGAAYNLVGAQPVEFFARRVDALIAGEVPPEDPRPKPPEMPLWAKPEGLAPDPGRPGYTMAGDPYKGNADAKLTVIEFTDFQCDACARHALETQPALDEQFVGTGKVRWVVKHFPLREHAHAPVAAAAAECAAEQGRFWEMHHRLFEQQAEWSKGEVNAALVGLAAELKLDAAAFTACLNSRQALEQVLRDLYDAQGVVQQTPTFIMVYGDTGTSLRGARPADQFAKILERLLKTVNADGPVAAQPAPVSE